jgi:hypothetical protein
VELKTAIESGKQVFIFVERQVYGEYSTYQKNKDLEGFRCLYVYNPLVYKFIDEIYALPLNNAIKDFDGASDIILFLREQWAGLFQRYLQERERINEQSLVKNLQSTASTLQNLVTYFNKSETDKSGTARSVTYCPSCISISANTSRHGVSRFFYNEERNERLAKGEG